MDSISPLAKILAEANGIDWRSLQGSGAGGSVVEQDILNYLSRIMSGDEEPPATPVDEAPPGWTGEMPPMPVAASGLEALSAAGVESDITDFVAQQSQAAQTLPAQTLPTQVLPIQPILSEPALAQSALGQSGLAQSALAQQGMTPPAPDFGSVMAMPARITAPGDDPEFELDDLDDDSAADHLTAADSRLDPASHLSAETPIHETVFLQENAPAQPEFGSAAAYGAALSRTEPDETALGAAEMGATVFGQPVHPEAVQSDSVLSDSVLSDSMQSGAVQVEPVQVQQPAYDPVALDADADFVMADRLPGLPATPLEPENAGQPLMAEQAVASQPTENSQATGSGQPEYGRPAGKEQATGTTEVAATAGATGGFGLGGFLSRLYGGKAKTEAAPEVNLPAASAAPSSAESAGSLAAGSGFTAPAPHEPNLGEALIPQAPAIPGTPVVAPLVADQWRDQELTSPELPNAELPALGLTEVPHTELGQPTDLPEAHETDHPGANQEARQEADGETQPLTDHQAMSEHSSGAAAPRPAPEAPTPEVSFSEQLVPEQYSSERQEAEQPTDRPPSWTDAALPLGVAAGVGAARLAATGLTAAAPSAPPSGEAASTEAEQDAGAQQSVTAPAHAEPPVPATATSAPALSPTSHTAITLRLNLDLHALETARAQLSTALMREIPLGMLVARAAARSLSTLGLHTGEGSVEGVALANHTGQPLAADLRAEFRASLDGLGQVAQAQPALLVLDASALGLDELHRGECSLSVGRAAADGAVLSLRGDLDPARGAQFLHEVAGLLGTPILLLF